MKAVVLISGGMDSATLLHHVVKDLNYKTIYALSFNYGQKHSRELEVAKWQCEQLQEVVEWKLLDIRFLGELTKGASALTDDDIIVPELGDIPENERSQPATYVPNRNMVMLALAATYAEGRGCHDIFYGAQAQDEYGYWDCTADFVIRINEVLNLNRKEAVQIKAPFTGLRKSEELAIGLRLGVDFSKTWSCYRGGERPCKVCPTCIERQKAFEEAGAVDPLDA